MDEESITTVRDELTGDTYELTVHHKEEINKLLEEYDDQQITLALELYSYEKECRQQERQQEAMKAKDEVMEQLGQESELESDQDTTE